MTVTVCIIQARLASTRLPGKVLLPLGNRTVLAHVLDRAAKIEGVDRVVCATVQGADGDAVAQEAAHCGAVVYRGSETDVLRRYAEAAEAANAATIVRITSDCPLIDPAICAAVLALHTSTGADYAANNMPPGWPHGLDCEVFSRAALEAAHGAATVSYDREHVTPWIRNNAALRRVNLPGPGGRVIKRRWTLDFPEDYSLLTALFARLPEGSTSWTDAEQVMLDEPDLEKINRGRTAR
jgi:glutamate-1-semialdehyde 2,1-aminomutase/spore coat polysaccharide biosynthesis protein SpsF